jgi:hypothetical protein
MTSLLWGPDIQGNVDLIEELFPKTRHLLPHAQAGNQEIIGKFAPLKLIELS